MHWSTAADQPKSYESCLTVVTLIEGCLRKRNSAKQALTLPWQFKGTFRGISVGYEFRIGKAKRRWYLWKRKNCQSSANRLRKKALLDRQRSDFLCAKREERPMRGKD